MRDQPSLGIAQTVQALVFCNAILVAMTINVAKTAKHLGTLLAAAQALLGTITGLMGAAMEFRMPGVGGTGYDHPGVI